MICRQVLHVTHTEKNVDLKQTREICRHQMGGSLKDECASAVRGRIMECAKMSAL